MDLNVLLNALSSSEKASTESNPFRGLETAGEGIGQALLKNAQNYDTKDTLIGSALAGLFSGVTGNLADSYQDKQSGFAREILQQALAGNPTERPDGMNSASYNALQNPLSIFAIGQEMEKKSALQKAQADLQGTLQTEAVKAMINGNPYQQERGEALFNKLTGGQQVTQTPGTPEVQIDPYTAALKKYKGSETLAENEVKTGFSQQQQAAQNQNSASMVGALFDQAAAIPSMSTFNPLSGASEKFESIRTSLIETLQRVRGPEINEPFRKQIEKTLPDWNDTKDIIKQKQASFEQLLKGVSPVTPLANGAAPMGTTSGATPSANQPQYEIRTAPNGQKYKVLLGQ